MASPPPRQQHNRGLGRVRDGSGIPALLRKGYSIQPDPVVPVSTGARQNQKDTNRAIRFHITVGNIDLNTHSTPTLHLQANRKLCNLFIL
ncbi:MAG: hypothetical protein EXR21_07220 [Flavobacteriaceae bacterium]|nr:hypothetical protein [Flavobacteriaceae bacterium]